MVRILRLEVIVPAVLLGWFSAAPNLAADEFDETWRRIAAQDPFPEDPPPAERFIPPAQGLKLSPEAPSGFALPPSGTQELVGEGGSLLAPPLQSPATTPNPAPPVPAPPVPAPPVPAPAPAMTGPAAPVLDPLPAAAPSVGGVAPRIDLDQAAADAQPARPAPLRPITPSPTTGHTRRQPVGIAGSNGLAPSAAALTAPGDYSAMPDFARSGPYDPNGTLTRFRANCACQDVWCGYAQERAAYEAHRDPRMHGTCSQPSCKRGNHGCGAPPITYGGGRSMPEAEPLCAGHNPWATGAGCDQMAVPDAGRPIAPAANGLNGSPPTEAAPPVVTPEAASVRRDWVMPPTQVAALGLPVAPSNSVRAR
jgi:hypothetical protein